MQSAITRPQPSTTEEPDPYGWHRERKDLLRAVAAGAIVGTPLLYTMEMWQRGMTLSEWHLLAILLAVLALNFVFCLFAGMREEYTVAAAISDAVTSVGIGILFAAAVLALIGEFSRYHAPTEMAGKLLITAGAVSLGASFANSQMRGKSRTGDDPEGDPHPPPPDPEARQIQADLKDAGAAAAGATVFTINLAPTEEILVIASRLGPWQLLALLGAGILLCYVVLFASGFEQQEVHVPGPLQQPAAETVLCCAVSLGAAFILMALIGEREHLGSVRSAVAGTVVLGLPAMIGGAAGRLIA
jgi:putative integral membrane protein (TIGR02587 family)